jgi:hypothetical protein
VALGAPEIFAGLDLAKNRCPLQAGRAETSAKSRAGSKTAPSTSMASVPSGRRSPPMRGQGWMRICIAGDLRLDQGERMTRGSRAAGVQDD